MNFRVRILLLSAFLFALFMVGSFPRTSLSFENSRSQDSAVAPSPTASPTPSPTPCPSVSISTSAEGVKAGDTINFTAALSDNTDGDALYTWSISGGRIIGGDGTQSLQVLVTAEPGQSLSISIEVEIGSCVASSSITLTVANLPPADFGKLAGVVRDPQGRGLSGATVTVFLGNNSTAQETTGAAGRYEFNQLIVGQHSVEASHSDFGPSRETVTIRKDRTTRQNFRLRQR